MLINPEKMTLLYRGVKFKLFEFERDVGARIGSNVFFFAPICSQCVLERRLTEEYRQGIAERDGKCCGVEGCDNEADFIIEFNFSFEESDVEEIYEEVKDPMEELYAELNFD